MLLLLRVEFLDRELNRTIDRKLDLTFLLVEPGIGTGLLQFFRAHLVETRFALGRCKRALLHGAGSLREIRDHHDEREEREATHNGGKRHPRVRFSRRVAHGV